MLRKYFSFLLMLIAYTILLGHSIVPHHHHEDNSNLNFHHEHDHDHSTTESEGGLNHLFSHFLHASDELVFTGSYNFQADFSKQLLSVISILPDNLSFISYTLPPLEYKPPADEHIYRTDIKFSFGLKAPPSFLA